MGNRGMTNWKLGAFFVIGMLLFATVFINAVVAAERMTVEYDDRPSTATGDDGTREGYVAATSPALPGSGTHYLKLDDTASISITNAMLNAGSLRNMLRFTYTAFNDLEPAGETDIPDMADTTDEPIDMSGGSVRIGFHGDWDMSTNYVRVELVGPIGALATPNLIYETGNDGKFIGTLEEEDDQETHGTGNVSFGDKYIIVTLDSRWSPSNRTSPTTIGMSLVVTFADITAPNPDDLSLTGGMHKYVFNTSSKTRNGSFGALASEVAVPITSILGDYHDVTLDIVDLPLTIGIQYTGRSNKLERNVTITPGTIYKGEENVPITIEFKAPGPMYGAGSQLVMSMQDRSPASFSRCC